jgi:GINS complex subunit 1
MQEMDLIQTEIIKNLNDDTLDKSDPVTATNFMAYMVGFLRSKRVILGYLYERMQRIKRLRWQCGVTLPAHIEANMHQTEKEFLEKYSELLSDYNADLEMDLTSDLQPPKDGHIEVRILKNDDQDGGIVLEDRTLKLRKNHVYYLKRTDAEMLIQRGYAQQINILPYY